MLTKCVTCLARSRKQSSDDEEYEAESFVSNDQWNFNVSALRRFKIKFRVFGVVRTCTHGEPLQDEVHQAIQQAIEQVLPRAFQQAQQPITQDTRINCTINSITTSTLSARILRKHIYKNCVE